MRKFLIILFCFCNCIVGKSQQDAHYSQFFSNKLIQNPAYAGDAGVMSWTALHRQQWIGLKGAPSTQNISFQMPAFKKRVGLGLSILRDDITISENWRIISSYAYRIPLDVGTLSLGIQADLRFMKIKWNEVVALEINDGEIPEVNNQTLKPNVAAGIYYSTRRFYAGIAAQNLISERKFKNVNTLLDFTPFYDRHFYIMAGYALPISENIDFAPVALLKLVKNTPFDLDLNASFIFYDRFWAGMSWRKGDSIDAILQYQLNQQMRLGVAYDFTISELEQTNSGTYEIMLQYDFNFKDSGFSNLRFF